MNDYTFTPSADSSSDQVPFFEDATAALAPYYSSQKNISQAKNEITAEMVKLDGAVVRFEEGYFGGKPKRRYGYQIRFLLNDKMGLIRVAALPIRKETTSRLQRAKVQALLNVRDWLKSSVTQSIFCPGSNPLLGKLLTDDGQTTVEDRYAGLALPASTGAIVNAKFRLLKS